MDPRERFLAHRVHEEWVWLRLHHDAASSKADALAYLRSQCGLVEGRCPYAQSDYCRLDCPFRQEDED